MQEDRRLPNQANQTHKSAATTQPERTGGEMTSCRETSGGRTDGRRPRTEGDMDGRRNGWTDDRWTEKWTVEDLSTRLISTCLLNCPINLHHLCNVSNAQI